MDHLPLPLRQVHLANLSISSFMLTFRILSVNLDLGERLDQRADFYLAESQVQVVQVTLQSLGLLVHKWMLL